MNKHQNGYGAIESLLIIIIVSLLGFVGWYIWNINNISAHNTISSKSKLSEQNNIKNKDTNIVSIALISKSTGKPIVQTKVHIYSDNGIRCIQAPCPTNSKSWDGATDQNGVITVPKDNIQYDTYISPLGYQSSSLEFDEAKTFFTMTFEP